MKTIKREILKGEVSYSVRYEKCGVISIRFIKRSRFVAEANSANTRLTQYTLQISVEKVSVIFLFSHMCSVFHVLRES